MPRKRKEGTRAPNGASTIYLGKDGYWHGRVTMGTRDDGKPDRPHVQAKTEAEVINKVRELEKRRDSGKRVKAGTKRMLVREWLTHWVENIAQQSVRETTMVGYRAAVYKHLIPGIGAHRLDRLEPEHLEKLYARMIANGSKPGTAHQAHRTVKTALNEAVRRGRLSSNPASLAKAPRVEEDEVEPFTVAEAQRIMEVASLRRNGVRFALALTLGLRKGEALGLKWSRVDILCEHGCGNTCGKSEAAACPAANWAGSLRTPRQLQRHRWRHGCKDPHTCGAKHHRVKPCKEGCKRHRRACPPPCPASCTAHASSCPKRVGGGLREVDVKSRAGRRAVGIPGPLAKALHAHRQRQATERERAGSLWQEGGWVFTQVTGRPIDPRADHDEWKGLLAEAGVRDARLHDARHTAATMLLVLKVPTRAVMEMMGWSQMSMTTRYQHIPPEVLKSIADAVGGLYWDGKRDED